ncbi:hypothetical protein [Chryseobacterium populi]|uniref:Uncharacterized protein n=1 Tax=Chryseobacterium populi TaxID=1144316 RepID=J2JZK9_9FLAO|nr:hypothetical protein [Chryseobacterium populi]EJL73325.1 hypothetical protein PMI13_01578 [Chryseobacterium populi]
MKNILLLWQKTHYNIYRFNVFTTIYVFGLPITLLLKNKYILEIYKKRGVNNPEKLIKETISNPKVGTINWLTDGFMILFIALICFSILNLITAISGYIIWKAWSGLIFILLIGIPAIAINYFSLWQNDKYLTYFKEFEKETKEMKRKWTWISLSLVLGIFGLLIFSFYCINNISKNKTLTPQAKEKKINDILNKVEDSLYQDINKDSIDANIENRLEKIEDSLYKNLK